MQSNDLATLASIKNALIGAPDNTRAVKILDPAREVEESLVGFLKHRLTKLQNDVEYEDTIKEVLMSRIAEANISQLITLLEIVQKNSNIAVEKVLAPFISQSGDRTILDHARDTKKSRPEDEIFAETDNKETLQALVALSQLVDILNEKKKTDEPVNVTH